MNNNCQFKDEEIKRLQAELDEAKNQIGQLVFSSFEGDYPPTFTQGLPTHELQSIVTAKDCKKMVDTIEQLTERVGVLEKALQEIYDTGEGSVISGGFCTESMIDDMREGMETIILQAKKALEDSHE